MKKSQRIVIGVVGAIIALVLAKNLLIRVAVVHGVKVMTGLRLKIKQIDIGLTSTHLGIQGLKVMNPDGFHDPVMLDLPEIYVEYDLGSFFKGKTHLQEVRLTLSELTVVKNERGQLNLDAIQAVKAGKAGPGGSSQNKPAAAAPPLQLQVDLLELNVGKVVYKDYSSGAPQIREFNVNIHERFRNVQNPYVLAGLIVSRALAKTAIARLTNFNVGALQSELADVMNQAVTGAVNELGKGAWDSAGDAVKGTTDTLKKVLPFGN